MSVVRVQAARARRAPGRPGHVPEVRRHVRFGRRISRSNCTRPAVRVRSQRASRHGNDPAARPWPKTGSAAGAAASGPGDHGGARSAATGAALAPPAAAAPGRRPDRRTWAALRRGRRPPLGKRRAPRLRAAPRQPDHDVWHPQCGAGSDLLLGYHRLAAGHRRLGDGAARPPEDARGRHGSLRQGVHAVGLHLRHHRHRAQYLGPALVDLDAVHGDYGLVAAVADKSRRRRSAQAGSDDRIDPAFSRRSRTGACRRTAPRAGPRPAAERNRVYSGYSAVLR